MPEHGLLSCSIELGESNTRLREYDTKYANKTVETYVAIPSQPTPFGIRLNAKGYIAPGLAIFVFIDGVYQANRNKRGLKQPTLDDLNAANFEVRLGKKEDLLRDGRVIARGWWFEKLNIVPADTKATINEDVMNNIGIIEVVVLRCQDNPKNAPVNPFDFPKLPVLIKSVSAVSNTKSSSRQDRKAASKKAKAKEPSDDGSTGGMFGLFDGAGDCPMGLDGHYDSRQYQSHRDDDRPRRDSDRYRRYESPRTTQNPRDRILVEESPRTATPTDEERRPRVRVDKGVHFQSPLTTSSRRPPSDSTRQPSGSQYSQRGRDELHPHLLRPVRSSPERAPFRDDGRRRYSDVREPRNYRDERRRSSPERVYHVLDDRDEHPRRQHRSGESIHEGSRSRGRSTVRERSRIASPDRRPGRSGGSNHNRSLSWSSDEERGRNRHYVERDRRRSRSSQMRQRYLDRSDEDKYAEFHVSFKGLGEDPSKKQRQSRRERAPSPSSSDSHTYVDQHHSSMRKSSKSHASQTLNISPALPPAITKTENRQPIQQAAPANRTSSGGFSFFGDNHDGPQQTNLAHRPRDSHREPTAQSVGQTYSSNHPQNPAANQYGFGPNPATYSHNMAQPAIQPNTFSSQPTLPGQMTSGQQNGNGPWSVNNYPQQPMHGFPEAQAFRPPQAQPHFPQASVPQGPQSGQLPLQPYRSISGPFDHQVPSQHGQTNQFAPIQRKLPDQVGRPSPAPVSAAVNPQSLISIIQQLKDLGVISIPGQDKSPKARRKTASGHRLTCPQNGDRPVNPTCLKHGDHAKSAQQHFATWMTGGNPDLAQGKEWFEHLANEHIACTCEPHQKPGPCTCNPGGGNQGSGGSSKSDDSKDKKDNKDQQGDKGGWGNEDKGKKDDAWGASGGGTGGTGAWDSNTNDQTADKGNGNTSSWDTNAGGQAPDSGSWETNQGPGDANNNSGGEQAWGNSQSNNGGDNSGGDQQNGWDTGNIESGLKSEKPGSSKSKLKSKTSSSAAKEGGKAAPSHEKPYTRSYWKAGENVADSANSGKKRGQHYTMPEDPIYTLSESKAKEFNVRHQVRGGMGLEEKKKTHRPLYLDNFDEPYAVFRFKYRSRDMLKKILGEDVKESPEEFQEWLGALSKEQLIAEMLRKKESGAWKSDDGSGDESDAGSKKGDKGDNSGGDNNGWGGDDAATGGASGGWGDGNQTNTPATDTNPGWGDSGVTATDGW